LQDLVIGFLAGGAIATLASPRQLRNSRLGERPVPVVSPWETESAGFAEPIDPLHSPP
jgi:hypothetical protein